MTLSHSIVDVAAALEQKLNDNAATLGLKAVYYGDQERLATTPVVCVEPDTKVQEYRGGGVNRMLGVNITIFLLVYHSFVQSPQENRRGADQLAEAIEDLIHQDVNLGGLVIECHVSEVASGYATKGNSLVRANRITVVHTTQNRLPS